MSPRLQPATPLADISEKEWDAQLFNNRDGLATTLGWKLRYHTLRSKGSRSGFPDRVIVRDRIIYAELKREKTGPTDDQIEWLDGLSAAGGETYLWRPSDLDEIALILGKRWAVDADAHSLQDPGIWRPRSLWIPGVGRADTHHDKDAA